MFGEGASCAAAGRCAHVHTPDQLVWRSYHDEESAQIKQQQHKSNQNIGSEAACHSACTAQSFHAQLHVNTSHAGAALVPVRLMSGVYSQAVQQHEDV